MRIEYRIENTESLLSTNNTETFLMTAYTLGPRFMVSSEGIGLIESAQDLTPEKFRGWCKA